jgi:hypothetical protein
MLEAFIFRFGKADGDNLATTKFILPDSRELCTPGGGPVLSLRVQERGTYCIRDPHEQSRPAPEDNRRSERSEE